jgi:hypothetical protein
MTGLPDFNKPAFFAAEWLIREKYSCWVLNPAKAPDGLTWTQYLRLDVEQLRISTVLYQLPGWENSKGACIEHDLALMAGLLVLPLPGDSFDAFTEYVLRATAEGNGLTYEQLTGRVQGVDTSCPDCGALDAVFWSNGADEPLRCEPCAVNYYKGSLPSFFLIAPYTLAVQA